MKHKVDENISGKNFVLIQHMADLAGPGTVVLDYLHRHHARHVFHIAHPNLYLTIGRSKTSRMDHYENGTLVETFEFPNIGLTDWALYIKDVFLTIWWIFVTKRKIDVLVGMDNLNAFSGLVLRTLGKVDKVVYYVIDFVPIRFTNKLLNHIYHRTERFAAMHSDATWNLSERMIEGREAVWKRTFPGQFVVPHGLCFSEKKIRPISKIKRHTLVFMGYLNKEQGLELALRSIPALIETIPDIRLIVIGTGNYEKGYKTLTKKLNLTKRVTFCGSIPDIVKMERKMAGGAVGVATYEPQHGFNQYADPGKIKHYLSVGLPIVMTGLSNVAKTIEKRKAGFVVAYEQEAFVDAIIKLLTDDVLYKTYRTNVVTLAREYDWEQVLGNAFHTVNI